MKNFIYILFFFVSVNGIAQLSPSEKRAVDSLQLLIKNAKHDSVRIKALDAWDTYIYYFDSDLDFKLNKDIEKICASNLSQKLSAQETYFFKFSYGTCLNNLGLITKGRGDYFVAIDYETKSLQVREEIIDNKGVAASLNNIGLIYQEQNDYLKAIVYHERSLKISEAISDKGGMARSLGNLGNVSCESGHYIEALAKYEQSLKLYEELQDLPNIAGAYNNIGIVYHYKKENEKAIEYYKIGLEKFEKIGHKRGIAGSNNCIGTALVEMKEYKKAIEFGKKGLAIALELDILLETQSASQNLYISYKNTGQFEAALAMHELYVKSTNKRESDKARREIVRQEYKYEYEKKADADKIKKEEEKKLIDAQFEHEQTLRYALYCGLVLLVVFGVFMFNRFRVTQNQKNIIYAQKEIVDHKQKEIMDSIYYAKRIQTALLPTSKYIEKSMKRLKSKN